jgi:hypothetical protein
MNSKGTIREFHMLDLGSGGGEKKKEEEEEDFHFFTSIS